MATTATIAPRHTTACAVAEKFTMTVRIVSEPGAGGAVPADLLAWQVFGYDPMMTTDATAAETFG